MANFEQALPKLLRYEGGFVNDKHDKGGMTFCGISRKAWPDWAGWSEVDSQLARLQEPTLLGPLSQLVEDFYYDEFWSPLKCPQITDQLTAEYLFDFAVNSGHRDAVKALQRVVNTKPDGIMGPQTLAAVNAEAVDLVKFRAHRVLHYMACVAGDVSQMRFAKGWTWRALGL